MHPILTEMVFFTFFREEKKMENAPKSDTFGCFFFLNKNHFATNWSKYSEIFTWRQHIDFLFFLSFFFFCA